MLSPEVGLQCVLNKMCTYTSSSHMPAKCSAHLIQLIWQYYTGYKLWGFSFFIVYFVSFSHCFFSRTSVHTCCCSCHLCTLKSSQAVDGTPCLCHKEMLHLCPRLRSMPVKCGASLRSRYPQSVFFLYGATPCFTAVTWQFVVFAALSSLLMHWYTLANSRCLLADLPRITHMSMNCMLWSWC
jgi:hypothetical protein